MLEQLKNLCYHEDLDKFSARKRIFIRSLLTIIIMLLYDEDINQIENQLFSCIRMIQEKFYE